MIDFRAVIEKNSIPVTEVGCWIWTGGETRGGYGSRMLSGINYRAHRMAWLGFRGPIPSGACVCHRCDTRLCVNPTHLFLGSVADNNCDRAAKGRSNLAGKARGERSGTAKLTTAIILAIRADHRRQKEIAAEYGVNQTTISSIKTRKIWRHV